MNRSRLLVLAAAFLFSTGGSVIKAVSWDGFAVAGGRSIVAALFLWALLPGWRRFWHPKALAVGVAYGATLVLFVIANKLTTAANAIFLQSTAPLYVLVLAPWWLGERNRPSDFVLTAAIAGGMSLFFVGAPVPLATASDPALGNLVGAAAGVCWAFTVVGLRWTARPLPGREVAPGSGDLAGASVIAGNLVAFAICLPFAGAPPPTVSDVGWIAYLGVFQIGLAYVLMRRGLQHLPAVEVSLLLLLEPVLSAAIAAWVHGEQPGPWALAGCAVILAATAVRTWLAAGQSAFDSRS